MRLAAEPAEIRRASPEDIASAKTIIGDALAEYGLPFEPEGRDADVQSFGRRADHDDFVAEIDGQPAGVVSVGPQGEPGVAWVSKLFVVKALRGRKVGRALLVAAHDAARARGCFRIGLRTRTRFLEAIALYESDGYARLGNDAASTSDDVVYFRML
jgi:putative acetyltransferase